MRERSRLRKAMLVDNTRKVDVWTAHYKLGIVDFSTKPIDPFFNINTPEDLAYAEDFLTRMR